MAEYLKVPVSLSLSGSLVILVLLLCGVLTLILCGSRCASDAPYLGKRDT